MGCILQRKAIINLIKIVYACRRSVSETQKIGISKKKRKLVNLFPKPNVILLYDTRHKCLGEEFS